ncbi:hypothetical protein RB195_009194 [Necator americanus]|uniref:Uncharacterized protein n=1 Tax=Necator americanus TaxID=51031 RepID=A0ABR1CT15_NECAM
MLRGDGVKVKLTTMEIFEQPYGWWTFKPVTNQLLNRHVVVTPKRLIKFINKKFIKFVTQLMKEEILLPSSKDPVAFPLGLLGVKVIPMMHSEKDKRNREKVSERALAD